MSDNQFPTEFNISIKAGEYIIEQISDSTFKVKNRDEHCPLPDSTFTILSSKYTSAEPQNEDYQEAINAILCAINKEEQKR